MSRDNDDKDDYNNNELATFIIEIVSKIDA